MPETIREFIRVECRVHGVYFHFPLVRVDWDANTATVMIHGFERTLPILYNTVFRYTENAVNGDHLPAQSPGKRSIDEWSDPRV